MSEHSSPHPIRMWLKKHKLTQAWLAERIGATQAQVSNWVRDKNGPQNEFKLRIEEVTGGGVTASELTRRHALPPTARARVAPLPLAATR